MPADQMLAPVALPLDQSRRLQHSQMPGNGWQRNAKGLGQSRYPALTLLGKTLHYPPSRRVRQSRKDRRNPFLIVNHGVKCKGTVLKKSRK
jgi:hypothetical protein